MKQFKTLVALVLAVMMVMSATAAFAATVTNQTDHTYNVYQIFSGTQSTTAGDTKLGDIAWGTGFNGTGFLAALKADDRFNAGNPAANVFAAATTAKDVADVLGANQGMATAFANVAVGYVGNTPIASVDGNAVSPELPAGYYLFLDSTVLDVNDYDALNSALLQITNQDLTIAKKYNVPEVDKDILIANGADPSSFTHVEATDVNIGDTVTYEIVGTLPSNYADFETYYYKFTDTLSKGQSLAANAIKVYKNSVSEANDITSKFTIDPSTAIDGTAQQEISITNSDLKNATTGVAGLTSDSTIIVRYTVTITADAVLGATGNPNTVKLTFSNDPNHTGDGTPTSDTPEDHTLVFTYDLKPTKVDGANTATKLEGAQFVLKATNGDHNGKYVQIDASTHKLTGWLDSKPTAVETVPTSGNTGVLVSAAGGLFEVYGLDSGTYELEEIKAPVGYNLLTNAIEIMIEADVDDSEDNPALDELTITIDGHKDDTNRASTGILPMTVENNGGAVLPTTGGIGTTIFYVAGLVLVLGAAAIIIARRKAEQE